MAARKPLFMNATEGYSEEMATTDSMTLGGLTMGGDIVMGGNKITGLGLATAAGDAASKEYVDSVAQGLVVKEHCQVVAVANISALTGLQTIDNYTLVDGDRVLLTAQSAPDAENNGIWVAHSGAWTRPTDFNTGSHAAGDFTFVQQGTVYADTGWVCTNDNPTDVVGTDDLTFVQFSSAGVTTASTGLTKVGNDIRAVKGDGIELTSNSSAINVDLMTNPGLQLNGTSPNKKLGALVDAAGGLEINGASGLAAKLNGTTLTKGSSGLAVLGLPSLFQINGVAVGANVTSTNLDTLVGGSSSNADSLHTHSSAPATEAPKVENSLAVGEAIAVGDPVYATNTNNRIGKSDTIDPKARVIGVARTAQGTVGNTCEVVSSGIAASVLSGATAGDAYYLATGGGLTTSLPGASKRQIRVGFAVNATDLFVKIDDFGRKAA